MDEPLFSVDERAIFNINTSTLFDGKDNKDNSSVSKFGVSLGINSGIFLIIVIIFLTLRTLRVSPGLLNFRRYFNARTKGVKVANTRPAYKRVPMYQPVDKKELGNRRFPRGSLSWLWPIFGGYRIKKIFHTHGADAAMYLIWLRNCFLFCIFLAGPAMVVLLPINATGTNKDLSDTDNNYVTGMGIITVGNIATEDHKLAAHIVFTYIFSILAYIMVWATYYEYTIIRRRHFKRNCARAFTVMVEEIPKKYLSDKGLRKLFKRIAPVKVTATHIAWRTGPVRDCHDKRAKYISAYEQTADLHNKKKICKCIPWSACCPGGTYGPEEPTTTTGYCGCCRGVPKIGKKVDALSFYKRKVKKYEAKIRGAQENPGAQLKRARVGFVSFESPFMARVATYPVIHTPIRCVHPNCLLMGMKVSPAPEPEDVFWEHLNVIRLSFILRSLLITAIMLVLVFIWFLPTLFLTSVSNLQTLSTVSGFGWLSGIEDLPEGLQGLIQGLLPAVVLFVLFQLVYPILKLVVLKIAGFHVRSSAYLLVFIIYWAFLIINILFVVTIGGSLIGFLEQVIDHPSDFIDLLASTLPQQSLFFMIYLMVAGLGRQALNLLRVLNIFKWTFGLLLAKTPTERKWAKIPGDFEYPRAAAQDILMFTILIVYSVMAPLITVFGIFYFGISYMTSKYNMLYANIPNWEAGGKFWPVMYHPIMAGIMVFQLTMLGLLSVSLAGSTPALVIPPIFTAIFWFLFDWTWKLPTRYGPTLGCQDSLEWQDHFANEYLDPALRQDLIYPYPFDDDEHLNETYEPPPFSLSRAGINDSTTTETDNGGNEGDEMEMAILGKEKHKKKKDQQVSEEEAGEEGVVATSGESDEDSVGDENV